MRRTLFLVALAAGLQAFASGACANGTPPTASPAQIDIAPTSPPSLPSADAGVASLPPAPPTKNEPRAADGACKGACEGRPGNELVEALSRRAKQARRCYENALATDKTLRGRVRVHMVVGADGRICSARADSDKGMEAVASCAAAYFRSVAGDPPFPPPDGGCADITLPINFVPRTDDAGTP